MSAAPLRDPSYQLADRYARSSGRVYLTGVQALVRLPLLQRQRDQAAGLRTAGFISGYRGSPLGTYDMGLWEAKDLLEAHDVRFEPGINEDLAATAVWGSQQATLYPGANSMSCCLRKDFARHSAWSYMPSGEPRYPDMNPPVFSPAARSRWRCIIGRRTSAWMPVRYTRPRSRM